jgi:hypothetical protein
VTPGMSEGTVRSSSNLTHSVGRATLWCGLAATLGASILGISAFMAYVAQSYSDPSDIVLSRSYGWSVGLSLLSEILLLIGLIGLYTKQDTQLGYLGALGCATTVFGIGLVLLVTSDSIFGAPPPMSPSELRTNSSSLTEVRLWLSFGLFGAGWVLFGAAIWRAAHMRKTVAPRRILQ